MNKLAKLNRESKNASPLSLSLLLIVALAVFTVTIHTSLKGNNIGTDYYIYWVGQKALVEDSISPYDPQATLQSQLGIYGRPARPEEDQMVFVYPLYAMLSSIPTVLLSFDWAMSLWTALNIIVFLAVQILTAKKHDRWLSITTLLLYPVFFSLVMGNYTTMVTSCILFFYCAVVLQKDHRQGVQIIAGMLLAWSTVKPQFALLLIGFAILIAIRDKLFPFLTTFFLTFFILFLGSFLVLPAWFSHWLTRVIQYPRYTNGNPAIIQIVQSIFPASGATAFGWSIIVLLLIIFTYILIRWWQGKQSWLIVLAWAGITTFLVHPHATSQEQLAAIIPIVLWMRNGAQNGRSKTWEQWFFWLAVIVVSWLPMIINSRVHHIAIERSPILLIIIWAVWLIIRENHNRLTPSARLGSVKI